MENSRKSSSSNLLQQVAEVLVPVAPEGASILLGLSGGVDSVVLLHVLRQISSRYGWRLGALHVHHGLSPNADTWAALCSAVCEREGVPLRVEHVDVKLLRAMGIEAAARTLRHAALESQPVDIVALAHHMDDQVETLLLQLLRGAGVRGCAAMPAVSQPAHGPLRVRPLLNVPRADLLDYARQQSLRWVEDESNADDAYPRNFLRHRILPLLEQRFPAYRQTLTRSVRHFAEAGKLLDELATLDAGTAVPDRARESGPVFPLKVSTLRLLSSSRAKNVLRAYLHECGAPMPEQTCLEELLRQLCDATPDAGVHVAYGEWEVRRFRDHVHVLHAQPRPDAGYCVQWSGEEKLELPDLGCILHFDREAGQGLSLARIRQGGVSIRLRQGGEAIQQHSSAPRRTLKNLLQEHGIPPWQRSRLPLLFCGEELICVPGIATAAAFAAHEDEQGVRVKLERLIPQKA